MLSLGMMMSDTSRPAKLKVLDGEVQMMLCWANSSEMAAKGICLATGGFIVQFLCEKIQGQELYTVLWMGQIIGKPKVKGALLPTLGWGKQSIWLAASGRQTPFAGRSPHPLSCRGRPHGAN